MPTYEKLKAGKFEKNGKEYSYIVEIAQDFPVEAGNVRLRVIEEKPLVHKVRTRYDPEISLYGDKGASMDVLLGYDAKDVYNAKRRLLIALFWPFGVTLFIFFLKFLGSLIAPAAGSVPAWVIWPLFGILAVCCIRLLMLYSELVLPFLADYLKARDLKKVLEKEGFKQCL